MDRAYERGRIRARPQLEKKCEQLRNYENTIKGILTKLRLIELADILAPDFTPHMSPTSFRSIETKVLAECTDIELLTLFQRKLRYV
jgi:hypothetical protein